MEDPRAHESRPDAPGGGIVAPPDEESAAGSFVRRAMDVFLAGDYAGDYEARLIAEFDEYLPETPPWKK